MVTIALFCRGCMKYLLNCVLIVLIKKHPSLFKIELFMIAGNKLWKSSAKLLKFQI